MNQPARREAQYEDLFDLPDNLIGEILNGQLITQPRPAPKHAYASSIIGGELVPPYHQGRGGPGGAPGCWQTVDRNFWPAPYLVLDDGASIAPYNHFELGQPLLTEYVWGRQAGENTINP